MNSEVSAALAEVGKAEQWNQVPRGTLRTLYEAVEAAQERPADAALREAVWIVARKSDGEAMAVYAVEQDAVEDVARRHRRHRDRYKVEAWQVLQPSPEPAEQEGTER